MRLESALNVVNVHSGQQEIQKCTAVLTPRLRDLSNGGIENTNEKYKLFLM